MADVAKRGFMSLAREVECAFTYMLTSPVTEMRLEFDKVDGEVTEIEDEVKRSLSNHILKDAITIEFEQLGQRLGVILARS